MSYLEKNLNFFIIKFRNLWMPPTYWNVDYINILLHVFFFTYAIFSTGYFGEVWIRKKKLQFFAIIFCRILNSTFRNLRMPLTQWNVDYKNIFLRVNWSQMIQMLPGKRVLLIFPYEKQVRLEKRVLPLQRMVGTSSYMTLSDINYFISFILFIFNLSFSIH